MDNSFQRQGPDDSDMQPQPRGISANNRPVFESVLHWLSNLVQLTEDEQMDAGIYHGYLGGEYKEVESSTDMENV